MPRTDENGRGLQAVLSYLVDRSIPHTEIYAALDVARTSYANRQATDDFPNAEECRLVANHFGLNPLDIMLRFGLITTEEIDNFMNVVPARSSGRAATKVRKLHKEAQALPMPIPPRGRKLSDIPLREGMPPV